MGGFYLLRWQMMRVGWKEEDVSDFIIPGMLAVVLGARFGHVFFYDWSYYSAHPSEILKFWRGGLASHGATIGLIFALAWFGWKKKMSFAEITDRFSFAAALGSSLVRLGNFFNSEIVGRATDQTWGVKFPRSAEAIHRLRQGKEVLYRHPSQLYEFIMGASILLVLVIVDKIYGEKRPRGLLGALFLSLYFTGRFLVEFFKEFQTDLRTEHTLTMGQYLSIPLALFGYAWIFYAFKKKLPAQTGPVHSSHENDEKTSVKYKKKLSSKSKRRKSKKKGKK